MKKFTVTTIEGLTFGEKSKLAHKISKNLDGVYSVRLKLAWKYIKKNSFNTINALLFPTTENIEKAQKEYKAEKQAEKQAPKKQANKQAKKEVKKASEKSVKKSNTDIDNSDEVTITIEQLESSLETLNIMDDAETTMSVWQILKGFDFENKDGQIKSVKGRIYRMNVKNFERVDLKKSANTRLQEYRQNILDGIEEVNNASTILEVQNIVLSRFMYVDAQKMAFNILETGYDSKKSITDDMGYYERNSVSLEQKLHHKFESMDLVHVMIGDSKRLDFKMFKEGNPKYILSAIKMRLKNALRVLDKGRVSGEKVTTQSIDITTNEGEQVNLLDTLNNVTSYDGKFNNILFDRFIDTKHSLKEIYTDRELRLITLLSDGYTKKEIALNDGKSQNYYNRDYTKIKQKGKKFLKEIMA